MRAAAAPLTADEVAVRGARHAGARFRPVVVHREAHGAPREAPLKARIAEDLGNALCFGHFADLGGARNRKRAHAGRNLAALQDLGCSAEVFNAPVRAGADEDGVDFGRRHRSARFELNVLERVFGAFAGNDILKGFENGDVPRNRGFLTRVRAPGYLRLELRSVEHDFGVELRVGVGGEGAPVGDGFIPVLSLRGVGTALEVFERDFVRRNHAHLGAHFDRHVGERHAAFHCERLDGFARKFDGVARAARRGEAPGDGKNQVLGGEAFPEPAVAADAHGFEALLLERLGRHHVLDLRRADAEGKSAEGAVRRRVRVAADEGRPRKRKAFLGPDDVDDSLTGVAEAEELHAEFAAVFDERRHLLLRERHAGFKRRALGRDVVVHRRDHEIGPAELSSGRAQTGKGLRTRHFVNDVAVDVEEREFPFLLHHDVGVIDFFVERLSHFQAPSAMRRTMALPISRVLRGWAPAARARSAVTSRAASASRTAFSMASAASFSPSE